MLTPVEQILFVVLVAASLSLTFVGFKRIVDIVRRGGGELDFSGAPKRAFDALFKTVTQRTVLKSRLRVSLFHAFVAWGFMYYFLVNVGDLLEGYIEGFHFLGTGIIGDFYRLGSDLLSVAVLVGITFLVYRRFIKGAPEFQIRDNVTLHPKARAGGIYRDSAIVAGFITLHVGSRFMGESFQVAKEGLDPWQPFASLVSMLWATAGDTSLLVAEHAAWWLALGLILVFIPYFPYTKHLHIMAAPFNFFTNPDRRSLGALTAIDLEDPDADRIGPERIEHLQKSSLIDAFSCIMCNRCQDVCPPYAAGAPLSPAALEINKRYEINDQMQALAKGEESRSPLLESVISIEAVQACTSCGACVEICPVGNEPMQDILDIRRHLTLTEGNVPSDVAPTLRNIEKKGNPWGNSPGERAGWAEGMDVPVMADKKEAEYLFWVGCAGSFDPRAQQITQSIARLMIRADVDFAILGAEESCNGDPARRMGEEFGYQMAAEQNVGTLDKYSFDKVVTGCPHCFNALKHEYRDFGADLEVVHHTQLINELITEGKLVPESDSTQSATYHDSCYIGRYNGEYDAPREMISSIPGMELNEMPRNRERGFCCGGGGGGVFGYYQAPKDGSSEERSIPDIRMEEAAGTESETVASACPFCMIMLEGSPKKEEASLQTKDVAELVDEATKHQDV